MHKVERIEKRISATALVFDGSEIQLDDFEFAVDVDDSTQLILTADNIRAYYFSEFQKEQKEEIISLFIKDLALSNDNFFKVYVDERNLETYVSFFSSEVGNKYLVIVGYGETQPSRFKINLDGVWEYI